MGIYFLLFPLFIEFRDMFLQVTVPRYFSLFVLMIRDISFFYLLFSIHPMLFGFHLWYDIYIIFFWIYRNSVSFIKLSPKLMSILHTCKRVTNEFSLTSFLLVSVSQIVTRVIHKQHHIKDTVFKVVSSRLSRLVAHPRIFRLFMKG